MTRSSGGAPFLAILAALALLVGPAVTHADGAAEARFFDSEAREAFARRDYDRALTLFLESLRAAPRPNALYNVGVAAQLAQRDEVAYAHLDEYLSSHSEDAARRRDAEQRLAGLAPRLALVRVATTPPGSTVSVDGVAAGPRRRTPCTLVVAPGVREIALSQEDHFEAAARVEARIGHVSEIAIALERRTGTVTREVVPAAARVTLFAEDVASPFSLDGGEATVPVGHWRARVEADGFVSRTVELVVLAGRATAVQVRLDPIPAPRGRLLVHTGSVAARVLVDGAARAESPAVLWVEVGAHELRVEPVAGGPAWSGSVEITRDRAVLVELLVTERGAARLR